MRVLLAVHDFLPTVRAGTELSTYYIADGLRRHGVDVEVFFAEAAEQWRVQRREVDGLACTVVERPIGRWGNVFGEVDARVEAGFLECLDRVRPDVLHVNHLLHLSAGLAGLARRRGARVVFTLRDFWLCCPRIQRLDWRERLCERTTLAKCTWCSRELYSRYRVHPVWAPPRGVAQRTKAMARLGLWAATEAVPGLARMARRRAVMRGLARVVDCWTAPSRFLRDAMVAWGLPAERAVVIPNGFPRIPMPSGRRVRTGDLVFGFFGGMPRAKGLHVLLEAFRGIGGGRLLLFGRYQPDAPDLAAYRDVLAQPNVEIRGQVTESGKEEAFGALDALVVPSIWFENAPRVIQEAFVGGVPVIAADVGGMREMVADGVDGLHFLAGSSASLRGVIQRCVEAPALLRALTPSRAGVRSVEEQAAIWIRLYEDVVGRGLPGGDR